MKRTVNNAGEKGLAGPNYRVAEGAEKAVHGGGIQVILCGVVLEAFVTPLWQGLQRSGGEDRDRSKCSWRCER